MLWIVLLITLLALFWLVATFVLSGEDLSRFDSSIEEAADTIFNAHPDDPEVSQKIIHQLSETHKKAIATKSILKGLNVARFFADNLSCDLVTETQFKSVLANNVDCEWAIAPGADPAKRILFFHGGAFMFGSAKGHRKFCDQLSKIAGAAVLSVNYRMLPRFKRMLGVKDAQQAYLWLTENGPNGKQPCDFLMVAGDSAGGNLTHMIASWSKNNATRRPDGVIGFSPSLDQTLSNQWLMKNQKTDAMLGQGLGLLAKLPDTVRLWLLFFSLRCNPANPLVTPLFGDLSDLPPTLIHGSASEMLIGESIRYVNKARAAGSAVTFQVWKNQVHDWHLFNMGHGSADVAWNEVAKFISTLQDDKQKETSNASETEPVLLKAANQ